jgi:hypothetical protein
MDARCWLAIVYDWGDDGLTLAKTADPMLLCLAKRRVICDAEQRLAISREVDDIVSLLDEAELNRLQRTLNLLIPGLEDRNPHEQ